MELNGLSSFIDKIAFTAERDQFLGVSPTINSRWATHTQRVCACTKYPRTEFYFTVFGHADITHTIGMLNFNLKWRFFKKTLIK